MKYLSDKFFKYIKNLALILAITGIITVLITLISGMRLSRGFLIPTLVYLLLALGSLLGKLVSPLGDEKHQNRGLFSSRDYGIPEDDTESDKNKKESFKYLYYTGPAGIIFMVLAFVLDSFGF